jgi:hypothetical protein
MPKKGAASPAPTPVETATDEAQAQQTVVVQTDGETVTATNQTTGKTATVKVPRPAPAAKPAAAKGSLLSGTLTDEEEYITTLYWGPYGTGKTIDLLSMAKLDPSKKVLLINAEAGGKAVAARQHGIDPGQIVPWPPRGEVVTFDGLEAVFNEIAHELRQAPGSWLGGIWDSTSEIHDLLLEETVGVAVAKNRAILDAAGARRAGNIEERDPFDYESDDYQRMQAQFKSLMRKYRHLPWHFGLSALVRRDTDKVSKKVTYGPAVSPKLQNDIGGGPDIVIRTLVTETPDGPVWYGRTYATADEPAKDRFGLLPRELVNPTYDRVVAYVRGDLVEADDPIQKMLPKSDAATTPRATPAGSGKLGPVQRAERAARAAATKEAAKPVAEAAKAQVQAETETAKPTPARRVPTKGKAAAAAKPAPSELVGDDAPPF